MKDQFCLRSIPSELWQWIEDQAHEPSKQPAFLQHRGMRSFFLDPVLRPRDRDKCGAKPSPYGQKTEPTTKLFDNQQIAAEINCNFSRELMTNSTDGTQDRPCFTISA